MPVQYVIDEALSHVRVGGGFTAWLILAQHNEIDDGQSGHQLGSRPLGQQRAWRIGDFHHQQPAWFVRTP